MDCEKRMIKNTQFVVIQSMIACIVAKSFFLPPSSFDVDALIVLCILFCVCVILNVCVKAKDDEQINMLKAEQENLNKHFNESLIDIHSKIESNKVAVNDMVRAFNVSRLR